MIRRFNLPARQVANIVKAREAADLAMVRLFRSGEPDPAQIYHLLAPVPTEFLLSMMAKSRLEGTRRAISLYFTRLKRLKPELKGRDLVAMGYAPGPLIKEMLDRLLEARLNEKVISRKEERDFVRRFFGVPGQTYSPGRR